MRIICNKHGQLYSGIKIFFFLFFYFLALATASSLPLPGQDYYLNQALARWLMVIFCIVAFIFVYILEKRSPRQFGIILRARSMKHFILGLVIGILSISFIAIVLFVTNHAKLINGWGKPILSIDIFYTMLLFIAVGIDEELLIRGYMVHTLGRYNRRYIVYLVPAIIFGALHLLNPSVDPIGLLNIILVGILFTYMTLKSGNILMAIGFHITWNFFQGGFFGFYVSGMQTEAIYPVEVMGNKLITGGSFGLEGGLIATAVILLLMVITYLLPLTTTNHTP